MKNKEHQTKVHIKRKQEKKIYSFLIHHINTLNTPLKHRDCISRLEIISSYIVL